MIVAVTDTLLPAPVGFTDQPPGVDEVEHLARHRAISHGKIVASADGRIAPVERKPIQKIHELDQLHDVHLPAVTFQEQARGFGGLAEIKSKIHNNRSKLSKNKGNFN